MVDPECGGRCDGGGPEGATHTPSPTRAAHDSGALFSGFPPSGDASLSPCQVATGASTQGSCDLRDGSGVPCHGSPQPHSAKGRSARHPVTSEQGPR